MTSNGSHWLLLVGGSTIADKIVCETSASIDLTKDTIEVTCKDSVWKKYIDGEKGWSCPFEAVKDETAGSTQADIIDNILGTGAEVDVALVYAPAGTIVSGYSGKAIVSSVTISGGKNEAATISGTLQGTGTLIKMTV